MKKVIGLHNENIETINIVNISADFPIFVKRNGKFVGMIMKRPDDRWCIYLRPGGYVFLNWSRYVCMQEGEAAGFEFFTEVS